MTTSASRQPCRQGRRSALLQRLLLAAVMVALSTVTAGAAERKSPPLVISGSGTCVPIVRVLAREFQRRNNGISIEVPASIGSRSAIAAAVQGSVTVGMVSRPLTREESALGLTVMPFARTALVLGVHPRVAESEISSAELVRIYRGEKSNWRDGQRIVLLTRQQGDATIELLKGKVPRFAAAYEAALKRPDVNVLHTDQKIGRAIAGTRHALGITHRGVISVERLDIKPLRLDGVAPTTANVRSGAYPLVTTLAFVWRNATLPDEARAFLSFVKSDQGRRILSRYDFIPE